MKVDADELDELVELFGRRAERMVPDIKEKATQEANADASRRSAMKQPMPREPRRFRPMSRPAQSRLAQMPPQATPHPSGSTVAQKVIALFHARAADFFGPW